MEDMNAVNIVDSRWKENKEQQNKAVAKLKEMGRENVSFRRPVFFVPGWTDEGCVCWAKGYTKVLTPIKEWIKAVVKNNSRAFYVTFSQKESKACDSFLDFSKILREKIWDKIGTKQAFDIVGHSMGGLDSVAAIIDKNNPLLGVNNMITVATPHQGSQWGGIRVHPVTNLFMSEQKPHHARQCRNLDPDYSPIKFVNKPANKKKLLNRINKLYCVKGTRDMAVARSAKYGTKGLDPEFYREKVEIISISDATHSQKKGVTQDPRAMLKIIALLTDYPLPKPKHNYGYISRHS